MATKRQTIKRLLRPDYGFPILQELLAELLYETKKLNKQDIDKRYDDLLRIVFGSPRKKILNEGYKDDDALLARAAIMVGAYKLSEGQACEEIAKLELIKDYRFRNKIKTALNDAQLQEVASLKKRLQRKLKGKVAVYARMHATHIHEAIAYEETHDKELRLVRDWLQRYTVSTDN